jgi:hypothetical protein
MAKRWALIFGVVGYLLVTWMYSTAFNLLTWQFARDLLWYTCISCLSVTGPSAGSVALALLIVGAD